MTTRWPSLRFGDGSFNRELPLFLLPVTPQKRTADKFGYENARYKIRRSFQFLIPNRQVDDRDVSCLRMYFVCIVLASVGLID